MKNLPGGTSGRYIMAIWVSFLLNLEWTSKTKNDITVLTYHHNFVHPLSSQPHTRTVDRVRWRSSERRRHVDHTPLHHRCRQLKKRRNGLMNTTARRSLTMLLKRESKCSRSPLLSSLSNTHRCIEFRFLGSQADSDIDKRPGCWSNLHLGHTWLRAICTRQYLKKNKLTQQRDYKQPIYSKTIKSVLRSSFSAMTRWMVKIGHNQREAISFSFISNIHRGAAESIISYKKKKIANSLIAWLKIRLKKKRRIGVTAKNKVFSFESGFHRQRVKSKYTTRSSSKLILKLKLDRDSLKRNL